MTISRTPTLQPSWRRMAVAFLACAALVLGMVVPHDMAVEQAGAGAQGGIAASAAHPPNPAHFQDGEFKIHPPPVARLFQGPARARLYPPPLRRLPVAGPGRDRALSSPRGAEAAGAGGGPPPPAAAPRVRRDPPHRPGPGPSVALPPVRLSQARLPLI